jgi:Uma2 family endonuclease
MVIRTHHQFTVDDYDEMIKRGILDENDHVELIHGEILNKMPIGENHAGSVNRLNRQFNRRIGEAAIVAIQNPVRLADSEPEPDVTVLRSREDFYTTFKPRPADVLLLVEVSDSTLAFDRDVKRPLYAKANITEYWIINLTDDYLEVYRQPQPDGTYRDVQVLRRGQTVEIAALPGIVFAVADLL